MEIEGKKNQGKARQVNPRQDMTMLSKAKHGKARQGLGLGLSLGKSY
jgi:hypothetical protein